MRYINGSISASNAASDFDATAEDAHALAQSIPDADDIWRGFKCKEQLTTDEAVLEETAHLIRSHDRRYTNITLSLSRRYKLRFLCRALCWKAEAKDIGGYLASVLEKAGVSIAGNTDNEQAINAAVLRYLSAQNAEELAHKSEISRSATALSGIEIICADNGIVPSFRTASEVLRLIEGSSRDALAKIVKDRRSEPVEPPQPVPLPVPARVAEERVVGRQSPSATDKAENELANTCLVGEINQKLPLVATIDLPFGLAGDTFLFEGRTIGDQLHIYGPILKAPGR
ncbi:hypothetical protein K7A42_21965 [Agrobacterium sp. InxBP2]|uniref:hypothetical protein n=1 Tax=Agrobacterium sp. InxBP2 TaxID=2870329 RepID=UPI00249E90EB|nr:hypothetical protein [Agrobacterium sp. InxBP2]MCW8283570.1 hypothetical protein [Agrobacterium sp. InxBP2]